MILCQILRTYRLGNFLNFHKRYTNVLQGPLSILPKIAQFTLHRSSFLIP